MARRLAAWSIALLVGASTGCPAPAQESRAAPSPVATIDGAPITTDDLIRHLVAGNWSTATQTLTLEAILDLELTKAALTVPDDAVDHEQARIIKGIAPGKTVDEFLQTGVLSEDELRRQARTAAGWDEVFLVAQKVPRKTLGEPTNVVIRQLFIRKTMEGYEIRKRGDDPPPAGGNVIEVREQDGKTSRTVSDRDLAAFVLGLGKPASLREAVSDLVDGTLVDRELARTGKSVTAAEVQAWARDTSEKYKPPFDWRMICAFKQTTPDQERERWRRIQGWKRTTGWQMNEDDLQAYISANQAHLAGKHKNITDPSTRISERMDLPSYREWIVDEYETMLMEEWLSGLRSKAKVWIAPDSELAKLKKPR